MLRRYVQRREELVYCFAGATPELAPLPAGLEYHQLDEERVRRFFGQDEEDRDRHLAYLRFLANGCAGVLIAEGETWASVGWVSHPGSSTPPHLNRRIIGQDKLWTFYVHTKPAYRRRGLQKAGLNYRIRLGREIVGDGAVPVFNDVSPENVPSRRAQLRCGFEPAGRLRLLNVTVPRLGSWAWGRWTVDAPHPDLEPCP